MHLTLVTDDDALATRYESLYDWLAGEPDLRPFVALDKRAPAPGEMGSVTDAVMIAVGSGGFLTVLAGALGAWLSQARNRNVRIEIKDKRGGERHIVLEAQG